MQHTHLDFSHGHAAEMRVHTPKLVESVARAALRDVPGSQKILDQHFPKGDSQQNAPKPAPIKPQQWYDGYGTV